MEKKGKEILSSFMTDFAAHNVSMSERYLRHHIYIYIYMYRHAAYQSKIEKVPRGIRGEKSSKDMASSRNLVSTIGAQASPTMGDGTRCPEG